LQIYHGEVPKTERHRRLISKRYLHSSHEQTCKPSSVLPLGAAAIYLGLQLPGVSSDSHPRDSAGNIISLLFGLAPGGVYLASRSPGSWCALTAPLHPYLSREWRAVFFCGTFLRVTPTGRYPAPCPAELGLSSKAVHFRGCPVYSCLLSCKHSLSQNLFPVKKRFALL